MDLRRDVGSYLFLDWLSSITIWAELVEYWSLMATTSRLGLNFENQSKNMKNQSHTIVAKCKNLSVFTLTHETQVVCG